MVRSLIFFSLYIISQPLSAEPLDVSPYKVGVWGEWQVGCMVDPFIGPLCGVEKKVPTDIKLPPRAIVDSYGQLTFGPTTEEIRVWISKYPTDEFVSFGKIGHSVTNDWEVRIDGNIIWTITKEPVATDLALAGEAAEKIRDEMLQGQIIYLRTDVALVESMKKGTSYVSFIKRVF